MDPHERLWALIIGVNHYPDDSSKNLQGCVRDADSVAAFLRQETRSSYLRLTKLTSTAPTGSGSRRPIEEDENLPTMSNVVDFFDKVRAEARDGDTLFLHFSGHGTTISQSWSSNETKNALALLILDNEANMTRYWRGVQLEKMIKRLVEVKGVIATCVLDCCFSGSMVRNGQVPSLHVRYAKCNPETAKRSLEMEKELFGTLDRFRTVQLEQDWLINPINYTVLTACGPHEVAAEISFQNEGFRGVLSSILLQSLNSMQRSGRDVTLKSLHEYLATQFHMSWPKQTPMRFGNQRRSIFGNLVQAKPSRLYSTYTASDGELHIRAGLVHGIHVGDEFEITRSTILKSNDDSDGIIPRVLKAKTVRDFDTILEDELPGMVRSTNDSGLLANPVGVGSAQIFRVRLLGELGGTRHLWLQSLSQRNHWLSPVEDNDEMTSDASIRVRDDGNLEILDALLQKMNHTPLIPWGSTSAVKICVQVLQHIAAYRFYESLHNRQPNAQFESTIIIEPSSEISPAGVFEVKHMDDWSFCVKNFGKESLYLFVLSFTYDWSVENVSDANGQMEYRPVVAPSSGEEYTCERVKFKTQVPTELLSKGINECTDILKLIITNRPVSFPGMCLPPIELDIAGRMASTSLRGGDDYSEPASSNLSKLSSLNEKSLGDCWTTRTLIIRTTI